MVLSKALYASKIVSYAQGFMLLKQAAKDYNWKLNYGSIALMWRGGCIIRRYVEVFQLLSTYYCNLTADFWETLKRHLTKILNLQIYFWTTFSAMKSSSARYVTAIIPVFYAFNELVQDAWRKVVAAAVGLGIPTPCFSCALAFFDGYRSALLQ